MDDGDESGWSTIADDWAELWGTSTASLLETIVLEPIVHKPAIGPGTRLLDVGCGSGELLARAASAGATVAGLDPSAAMIAIAATRAPGADLRRGYAESLPWPDDSFDVVTAVNALQFADDTIEALGEFSRVTTPGGLIAVANWAEGARSDLSVIEAAVARADGGESAPDGDLREAGGLERLVADAGLGLVASRLVRSPWVLADADALVRAVLLGEDAAGLDRGAPAVLEAAERFRLAGGGYRLDNAFRLVIARVA